MREVAEKKNDENSASKLLTSREISNRNLLKPEEVNSRLTPEQRREKASKAGKKAAENKRKSRMLMDMARKILEMPVGDSYANVKTIMERFGIEPDDMNYGNAMLSVLAVKAMSGDTNAYKYVRDTAGMDANTVLREEQFEWEKEHGQNVNVNLDGEITTRARVQIYLPERDPEPE